MRPGHHWLCEFGDTGDVTSCEKESNLPHHTWEDYSGTRFYNGEVPCSRDQSVTAQS